MRLIVIPAFLVLTAMSPLSLNADEIVAGQLNDANWDSLVPHGKEVDAIEGDFVLGNSLIRAVVAQPRASRNANMTVRNVGGALLDLVRIGSESDQLSAFYPARRTRIFDEVAELTVEKRTRRRGGAEQTIEEAVLRLISKGDESTPEYRVRWIVGPAEPFVTLETTWKNTTSQQITLNPEDDLRADAGKEQMPKTPDGQAEVFWFHDIYWKQAYGILAEGCQIQCKSNARESVLKYEPKTGTGFVLKVGEELTLTRRIFVHQDLAGVLADVDEFPEAASPLIPLTLRVEADGQAIPDARLLLNSGEISRGTVVTAHNGEVAVRLPRNAWKATVSVAGNSYGSFDIDLAGGRQTLQLADYHPGTAEVRIQDGQGALIPAKVEFRGVAPVQTPDWGPETAEHFVKNLAYTSNGVVQTQLQAGQYELIVSRGPEYDAEFTRLSVEAGQTATLTVTLNRVLNTTGWVSADFHSHSSPSGDNTGSQLGRVLNLAAEHIEFAPCTEHNRISTYEPHLETLGLKNFVATVSGMELTGTPLPLNHHNIFPLVMHPRTQDGGAPQADASPEAQIERAAAWDGGSEKLIQQNHPDIGWLFYDKDGDQVPDEGYSRAFGHMNVMEIHPIDPLLQPGPFAMADGKPVRNQTAFNWLQLLNQGFRIYGVVNTDAHYNYHGSGGLRIWVKSSQDEPARISSDEMRENSRNGHIVMSNGPYLEATVEEAGRPDSAVVAGSDLLAKSRKVVVRIRVQTANWMDVDYVTVLVNGRSRPELTWTRSTHSEQFGKSPVRFQQTAELTLDSDAHVIVLTGHQTQLLGDVQGPQWGKQHPAALTNPIFVDTDASGFTPNRDTLGAALPVKFKAP